MVRYMYRQRQKLFPMLMTIVLGFLGVDSAGGQTQLPTAERLAFAAYRHGQWDIYSLTPEGTTPKQLTRDPFEDTDPVYSPDGTKLAYASRRERNWDIYLLDLETGQETRLTTSPHYDGAPAWNPDGNFIAYESYESGNLDIWLVDASGREPATNLTAGEPAGDFTPAWSPDGQSIAFSSWRADNEAEQNSEAADHDLFLLNIAADRLTRLTDTPGAKLWPAWQPNGERLAFVLDDLGRREIFTLDIAHPPAAGGALEAVTWLGRSDGPVWSPDGSAIAAIFQRWDGERLAVTQRGASHRLPGLLTEIITLQGRLTWHPQAIDFGASIPTLADTGLSAQYEEQFRPNDEAGAERYNLVQLNNIDVGTPWLADTVDDSFQAWRLALRDETGYDFLGQLSDATRDVGAYSETSQYASWHKSGRAIDTLFDYHLNGQLAHEIARETYGGETYWRVYLRCTDQSGGCGRPLVINPWNYSDQARTSIAPDQGGIEKSNLSGYYVDMTALAREYGWERISSYDDEAEYSWTWHFLAFEYWHYQKRFEEDGAANWYQAMLDIYAPQTLERFFNWQRMQDIGDDAHLIALKGIPLPLEVRPWWALVEQR